MNSHQYFRFGLQILRRAQSVRVSQPGGRVDWSHRFRARNCEITFNEEKVQRLDICGHTRKFLLTFWIWVPTFGDDQSDWSWLLHDLAQNFHCFIIGHIFEINIVHLQDHVTRFDSAIELHCTALHDTPYVYAAVASAIRLPDY
jgi:hypothetical protein